MPLLESATARFMWVSSMRLFYELQVCRWDALERRDKDLPEHLFHGYCQVEADHRF